LKVSAVGKGGRTGHHEIGIVTKDGKFITLKQGDKVVLSKD
jgi:hypothetical protein